MKNLPFAARQAKIRDHLGAPPGLSVSELARKFGVTEMTIRRDCSLREDQDLDRRTPAGARLTGRMMLMYDFRDRRRRDQVAKRPIATAARRLKKPGEKLILDHDTTTFGLAALPCDSRDLKIFPPSLAVALKPRPAPGVDQMMRKVDRRSVPLADHTKIGPSALACKDLLADRNIFITDTAAPANVLKRFARLGG